MIVSKQFRIVFLGKMKYNVICPDKYQSVSWIYTKQKRGMRQ